MKLNEKGTPRVAASGSGREKYSSLVVRNNAKSPSSSAKMLNAGSIPTDRHRDSARLAPFRTPISRYACGPTRRCTLVKKCL